MWRSYAKAALRALMKHRTYAAINVIGLTVAVAAAVMVFLYVRYETSYDRWLPDADRLVQLQTITHPPEGEPGRSNTGPLVAREALQREFPELEQVAAMMPTRSIVRTERGGPHFSDIHWSDSNIFDVLDLRFVRGSGRLALRDLSSVVLTEAEALRYFGAEDPIGRTITVDHYGEAELLRVTGVIADLPRNSHLDLQMIARFNPENEVPYFLTAWGASMANIYAKMRPGVTAGSLNARMPLFERRNLPPASDDGSPASDTILDFRLVPVTDVHLRASFDNAMKPGGDPLAVRAFSVIAALILLIACVNFTNLTTARATQRAREVGVRKAFGASRMQLVTQFLAESTLLAAIATLAGLALVEIALPWFNRLLGIDLGMAYFAGGGLLAPAIALTLLIGGIGGAYPAFYLSGFDPARVLRSSRDPTATGSGRLRAALVVFQFAASIALIICAAIVYAQTVYARNADPGFDRHGLLVLQNFDRPAVRAAAEGLRNRIERRPGVRSTALAGILPGIRAAERGMTSVQLVGGRQGQMLDFTSVDYGFAETMGIRLLAGRTLSSRFGGDDATVDWLPHTPDELALIARGMNVVMNEAAIRRLGIRNPADAVGRQISADLVSEGRVPGTIVGVIADARYGSLRDELRPIMYLRNEMGLANLMVRFSAPDPARLRQDIERVWKATIPDVPFEATFVEDELAELYDADALRGQVFALAAALAVLIACLGLFGLAAFTVERRRLEIAVRKVFGARDTDIVRLMVWQFSRPVLLANLIAWPIAWWLMRDWLNGFGERISLHAGWFVGAGAVALLIAVLTVASHALRASRARPALALRYE